MRRYFPVYAVLSWVIFFFAIGYIWVSFTAPTWNKAMKEIEHVGPTWLAWWWATTPTLCYFLAGKAFMRAINLPARLVANETSALWFWFEVMGALWMLVCGIHFFASAPAVFFRTLILPQTVLALALLVYAYWAEQSRRFYIASGRFSFDIRHSMP